MTTWQDVDLALDVVLTAVIDCRKAALKAQAAAEEAELQAQEAQHWSSKLSKKKLLFEEGGLS